MEKNAQQQGVVPQTTHPSVLESNNNNSISSNNNNHSSELGSMSGELR